ncbi:IscS subfamily cysteine desulfurase [Marinagarivorans algicola]|uniref:IscS subfamily cysteine desulfurase n=1 Tax=Marinagarivorans algicola TaxID=1513270 RepID=UPI0006B5338C|nr:IscS subfamily cysteine desulfurase [Marinagarivorans algicola]
MSAEKPKTPIYLDYAATTPVDADVAKAMAACLTRDGNFANPASRSHFFGWQAEAAVEKARGQLANLLNADPRSLVWTSGATESNNLALKGLAFAYQHKGKHIITSSIEHKAVLDPCGYLQNNGFDVTYLAPQKDGCITLEQVKAALREDTIIVALMQVNNETGAINPIASIAQLCRSHDVLLHVDAAQSVGKIPVDVAALGVHTLALSAHKFYGPKGMGALYVQRTPEVQLSAQIHGGGHQRGMRSGTLATHQIVGLGAAAAKAQQQLKQDQAHTKSLRQAFMQGLSALEGIRRNGDEDNSLDAIVNISFEGVEGETLLTALRDLAVSTGSACTSASVEPSYVLSALGITPALAHASLRFSFGRYTTLAEVAYAAEKIVATVTTLRAQR